MKSYITKMRVNGIKNIENDVVLNFYNSIIGAKINNSKSNIKAIYGPNGSGKSGIIHAIEIYKNIHNYRYFLSDITSREYVKHLINYKTNKFEIGIDFITYDDDYKITNRGSHVISLTKRISGEINIGYEVYKVYKVPGIVDSKDEVVFEVKNGEVVQSTLDDEILEKTKNLLTDRVLLEVIKGELYKFESYNKASNLHKRTYDTLAPLINFTFSIDTVTENEDQHNLYLYNIANKDDRDKNNKKETKNQFNETRLSIHSDRIDKKYLKQYKANVKELVNYMKIFKPDLIDIELDIKEDKDTYVIEKNFLYDDYKIHVEFESAGIKKLVVLFDNLKELTLKHSILFIDEFDANINDVYLIKFVEYFSNYLKGQLVFTTHNVGPMEVLKKRKHAIDFISSSGCITSWSKNGNYSVVNLYRNGMIKNLPFNVESYDFLDVFGANDE